MTRGNFCSALLTDCQQGEQNHTGIVLMKVEEGKQETGQQNRRSRTVGRSGTPRSPGGPARSASRVLR